MIVKRDFKHAEECGNEPVMAEDHTIRICVSIGIDSKHSHEVICAFLLPLLRDMDRLQSSIYGIADYRTPYLPIIEECSILIKDNPLDSHVSRIR